MTDTPDTPAAEKIITRADYDDAIAELGRTRAALAEQQLAALKHQALADAAALSLLVNRLQPENVATLLLATRGINVRSEAPIAPGAAPAA